MNSAADGSHSALGYQQSQFVAEILNAPARTGPFSIKEGGFDVYRRNLLAVAESALSVTYPTVRRLLGYANFQDAVANLLVLQSPTLGDWGEWGKALPQLIAQSALGRTYPFLAPIAELDWLRHQANRAADSQFDPASAQLLETHGLDDIGIAIAGHVALSHSIYPLVEILDWDEALSTADDELDVWEVSRPVLVCRPEFAVQQRYISPAEGQFLRGLRAGCPVGKLLDELDGEGFDFPDWLTQAINENLISHFYLI